MFGLVPFGSRKGLARKEDGIQSIFDVFNEPFFHDAFAPFAGWGGSTFKVDVQDKGTSYELTADLPGLRKEDLSLSYENNYLTISARQDGSTEQKDDAGNYIRRERHMGAMSRSFYIDNIDEARVTAEFKDGVLRVDMPKSAAAKRVSQIEIK